MTLNQINIDVEGYNGIMRELAGDEEADCLTPECILVWQPETGEFYTCSHHFKYSLNTDEVYVSSFEDIYDHIYIELRIFEKKDISLSREQIMTWHNFPAMLNRYNENINAK